MNYQRSIGGGRRGFTLIELMAALFIMAAVTLLVTRLTVSIFQVLRETKTRDTLVNGVDTALDALRKDTWSARSIRAEGNRVELREKGGMVVWQINAQGKLTRNEDGKQRAWIAMPALTFSGSGAWLTVGVDSGPAGAAKHETMTLTSQQMLAGGGT